MFCLLTGASHEWGVTSESFSGSIHKHQFHHEPVRWVRGRRIKEMKACDAQTIVFVQTSGIVCPSITCPSVLVSLPHLSFFWTRGCSRLQCLVNFYYCLCGGKKEQGANEGLEDRKERQVENRKQWSQEGAMHHYTLLRNDCNYNQNSVNVAGVKTFLPSLFVH